MIEAMEGDGRLVPGTSIIVEPTSGNTGIALAMVAAAKGYRCVLDDAGERCRIERRKVLRLLGAELVLTPAAEGMKGAIRRAEALLAEIPGAVDAAAVREPGQPRGARGHHRARSCGGTPTAAWTSSSPASAPAAPSPASAASGRRASPQLRIVAVEPADSPVISGGAPGPHKIQGIGAGFIPDNLDTRCIDEIVKVTNDEAFAMARRLAREEGILAGISSGAACAAALGIAARPENEGQLVVFVVPSTSERYISTELFEGLDE